MARKTSKMRADRLLLENGMAESREQAQALIMAGLVYAPDGRVLKPGTAIASDTRLEVKGRLPYVSRGGIKLAHVLERFGLDVSGLVALDVGASTGGFTDCLLQHGALRVIALDVGHGQLDYRLRKDPRVLVVEGVNAHYPFTLPQRSYRTHRQIPSPLMGEGEGEIPPPLVRGSQREGEVTPIPSFPHKGGRGLDKVDLATVDVSFISVTKVIPPVAQHLKDGGNIIALVKPQFEARREEVGRGGVIRDHAVHARVLARVIVWAVESGYRLRNLAPSPIQGDKGNREFFLLLQK